MRPFTCLLVLFAFVTGTRAASSVTTFDLVSYEAPAGDEFASGTPFDGVIASRLLAGDSAATLEPGVALPSSVFLMTTTASTTAADAVANRQYLQFSLSARAGEAFRLGTLEFLAGKGGGSGPRGWAVTTSLDNFASILATGVIETLQPNLGFFQIALPAASTLRDATVFRIHTYAPAAGNGIYLDSIRVTGTPVPEPSAAVLSVLSAMVLLRRRR